MLNKNEYVNDISFKRLSKKNQNILIRLDEWLTKKGYLYNRFWREKHTEPGGKVSIFQVINQKGREKNLITIRPQTSWIKIEVYWGQDNKHFYKISAPNRFDPKMMADIEEKYGKISN